MDLNSLEIYRLAREISREAWKLYEPLDWQTKKIMGDQCIEAIDSIAANIAEGFGRFHYLDRNKFNLNARGSLFESINWVELLLERGKVEDVLGKDLIKKLNKLAVKLNNYISATRQLKQNQSKDNYLIST